MKRRSLVLGGSGLWASSMVGGGLVHANTNTAPVANVIKFGQSASLTGGQANYGRDVRDGILAAFQAASVPGGTRYELVTLDDGGVKDRCAQNVASLIESGVAAIVGLTSGAGAEACMPVVTRTQTALLGTASGNMGIRGQAAGAAYHVRAGYDLEYLRVARYVKDFGMRRIGVVHLQDTSKANLEAMTKALTAMSIPTVETVAIDRNAKAFYDAGDKLILARVDFVLFATNAAPAAAIIDQMLAAGYTGMFYASSFAGQDLLDTLAAKKQSCIMSMVVPRPSAKGLDVVSRCRNDLAALKRDVKLGVTTLEGYIAGRTAVEAARAALRVSGGERIGRQRMKESLAGLRTDMGGYRVEFGPGVTQGSQYVDLIAIDRWGKLVA